MKFYVIQYNNLVIEEVNGDVLGNQLLVRKTKDCGSWVSTHSRYYAEYFETYEEAREKLHQVIINQIGKCRNRLDVLKAKLNTLE